MIDAAILVTRAPRHSTTYFVLSGPALRKDGGEDPKKSTMAKHGASTTWMGKLLYRLNAGRSGGCPVLVFGITPACISDWKPDDQA